MIRSHRRTRLVFILLATLVLTAIAAACSAQVSVGASGGGTPVSAAGETPAAGSAGSGEGGVPAARGAASGDMARILSALGYMRAVEPDRPVVVLLGGSAARESTISDAAWREQIERKGGPATLAWNMGSRNRTMAQNIAIVQKLPPGASALVYIGVNLGSFTSAQKSATVTLPTPLPTAEPSLKQPHSYSSRKILSKAKKKALVKAWQKDRYPVFKRNFATSAKKLEQLIKVCQRRGYCPVLFELPRNTAVIGSALNAPTKRYRDKCRALSKKYGIPWVSFVSAAKLPNSSFYDLWHLVEPGRKVWQGLLSSRTAKILNSDAFQDDGGS
ncbi:MAG: hypothetical protein GX624_06185 [Actinobacteria bacterium]|nr:hypothetical protein [Actinomycetota bacterium]